MLTHQMDIIMTLNEIRKKIQENRKSIRYYGVTQIGFFGSYVRGEEKDDSDIDVLVVFKKGMKTFDNFMDLHELLENIYNKKVDLVTIESVSKYIQPYIEKEVVYEKL